MVRVSILVSRTIYFFLIGAIYLYLLVFRMTAWTTLSTPNAVESDRYSFDLHLRSLSNSLASCNAMVSNLILFTSLLCHNYTSCDNHFHTSIILRFFFFLQKLKLIFFQFFFHPGYIGEFEIIDDHRSGKIVIQLNGHLNKTGVISPRFNIQHSQIESWVNLLLPARGFGFLILVRTIPLSTFFAYEPFVLARPLHLESLTMKKLVVRLLEENFWAMCIERCLSYCMLDTNQSNLMLPKFGTNVIIRSVISTFHSAEIISRQYHPSSSF